MSLVPNSKIGAINFFQSHIATWTANKAAIGLSDQQVADMTAAVGAANNSYLAAQQAYNAARSATAVNDADVATMRTIGASLISTIRAYAKSTGDANVYTLADIPAPKTPSPAGAPDAPVNVRGSIINSGAIELKWDGTLAYHTFYEVYRMFEGQSQWTLLASVGKKSFLDETVPANTTASVKYAIQAKRGQLRSDPSEPITIRMGVVGVDTNTPSGETQNTASGDGSMTIAA